MEDIGKPLISEVEEVRIKRAYLEVFNALANYVKDIDNRLPITKFQGLMIPMIKDLNDTKFVDNHREYADDLCKHLSQITEKLDEFKRAVDKGIIELRNVCSCRL